MKRILFICLLMGGTAHARQIVLDIPETEIMIVENDVLNAEQWIRSAWAGKVNKSKERLLKQEIDRSVKEGDTLPAGADAIVEKALDRPDYKNRAERDAAVKEVDVIAVPK